MVDLFELHIAPVPVALCGHGYDKVFNISNKLVTYLVALLNLAEGWLGDYIISKSESLNR